MFNFILDNLIGSNSKLIKLKSILTATSSLDSETFDFYTGLLFGDKGEEHFKSLEKKIKVLKNEINYLKEKKNELALKLSNLNTQSTNNAIPSDKGELYNRIFSQIEKALKKPENLNNPSAVVKDVLQSVAGPIGSLGIYLFARIIWPIIIKYFQDKTTENTKEKENIQLKEIPIIEEPIKIYSFNKSYLVLGFSISMVLIFWKTDVIKNFDLSKCIDNIYKGGTALFGVMCYIKKYIIDPIKFKNRKEQKLTCLLNQKEELKHQIQEDQNKIDLLNLQNSITENFLKGSITSSHQNTEELGSDSYLNTNEAESGSYLDKFKNWMAFDNKSWAKTAIWIATGVSVVGVAGLVLNSRHKKGSQVTPSILQPPSKDSHIKPGEKPKRSRNFLNPDQMHYLFKITH